MVLVFDIVDRLKLDTHTHTHENRVLPNQCQIKGPLIKFFKFCLQKQTTPKDPKLSAKKPHILPPKSLTKYLRDGTEGAACICSSLPSVFHFLQACL